MHMADALLSPAVGGAMWAVTAGLLAHCSRKVKQETDDHMIPLMGVLGAFVFAAQMINFTIPGTGSSGHLGGGVMLAILLGNHAAFLVIASVLTVQALFFGDGGLLALGCNIFNLGFFPCFVAYPFIYRAVVKNNLNPVRLKVGAILASVIGLQLGALGVVLETTLSGISELPFSSFLLMMQPIHLAIGLVEGLVTAAVVSLIWRAQPLILERTAHTKPSGLVPLRKIIVGLAIITTITGGIFSWFASQHPDGLEWSMFHVAGTEELQTPPNNVYSFLAHLQEKTTLLPDYDFKVTGESSNSANVEPIPEAAPVTINVGTTVSGLIGGIITLTLTALIGLALKKRTALT